MTQLRFNLSPTPPRSFGNIDPMMRCFLLLAAVWALVLLQIETNGETKTSKNQHGKNMELLEDYICSFLNSIIFPSQFLCGIQKKT